VVVLVHLTEKKAGKMLHMPNGKNFECSKQAFTELTRSSGCT